MSRLPKIFEVIFHFRDLNPGMVRAWQEEFAPYSSTVKVWCALDNLWKTAKFTDKEVKNYLPKPRVQSSAPLLQIDVDAWGGGGGDSYYISFHKKELLAGYHHFSSSKCLAVLLFSKAPVIKTMKCFVLPSSRAYHEWKP